jgi:hypothetical protein
MNKKHKITNEEVEHSPKHPFFISPPSSLKEGSAKDCAEERGGLNTATRKSEFEIKEEQEIMNKKHKITNEEVEHSPKHPFFISPPSSLKEGSVRDCVEEGVV